MQEDKRNQSDLISKAIIFALDAHQGDNRKDSKIPFVTHPIEAAIIVATITDDPTIIAAALLHDTVEDCPNVTLQSLRDEFGDRIASLVEEVTEDKMEHLDPINSWKTRKERTINHLESSSDLEMKTLILGDKLANMRSIKTDYLVEGDKVWDKFNEKSKEEQEWYYKSILKHTDELKDTVAWKEYKSILDFVF